MRKFQPVVQMDEWGCGVACVASLLGIEGSEPYDGGHYNLRVPNGWMDPWVNMARPEEDREADVVSDYPEGTWFSFALVPKSS